MCIAREEIPKMQLEEVMFTLNEKKFQEYYDFCKISQIPPWESYPERGSYYNNSPYVANAVPVDMVFLGDDVTACFEVGAYFQEGMVVKRGGMGSTLKGVCNAFYANCLQLKPKLAIVQAGLNDMAHLVQKRKKGERIDETDKYAYLGKMRSYLRKMLDEAKAANVTLWLASLLPLGKDDFRNELVVRLNTQIQALCQEYNTTYVDYHSAMCKLDGTMRGELTFGDYTYPNVKGYNIMYEVLCKHMGKPARKYEVNEEEYQQFVKENYPGDEAYLSNRQRRREFVVKNSQILLNHIPVDLLFIGDSITEQYETSMYFRSYGTVINRGYGGEKMFEIRWSAGNGTPRGQAGGSVYGN